MDHVSAPSAAAVVEDGGGGRRNTNGCGLWSWIQIDSSGREILCDVGKYVIMRRLKIDARDFRILDPLLSYPSTIIARDKAILLNLEHIKAIITTKEVLLCDPTDANVIRVAEELGRRLQPVNIVDHEEELVHDADLMSHEEDGLPFEFRALEVAVEAICGKLDDHTKELETDFYPALDMLTSKISSGNLDRIRKLKNRLTKLTARVQKVRDELEQILDDHDNMESLHLSRKLTAGGGESSTLSNGGSVKVISIAALHGDADDNYVEGLEMLIEAYFMKIDGTLHKLTALREYVGSTQAFVNIQLEYRRNQLLQLELFLSTGTLCLAILAAVVGLFGVNIPYTWNHGHGYLFKWVLVAAGAISASVCALAMWYARRKGLV